MKMEFCFHIIFVFIIYIIIKCHVFSVSAYMHTYVCVLFKFMVFSSTYNVFSYTSFLIFHLVGYYNTFLNKFQMGYWMKSCYTQKWKKRYLKKEEKSSLLESLMKEWVLGWIPLHTSFPCVTQDCHYFFFAPLLCLPCCLPGHPCAAALPFVLQ